jgi:hypothetical protein
MNPNLNRRLLVSNIMRSLALLGLGAGANSVLSPGPAQAARDRFRAVMSVSTGAVAARFSDFAVQSPEGNTCTARLAYPMVLGQKLPVLVFCPDEGAVANQYDLLTGALAAQGFFVLAVDRRLSAAPTSRTPLTPVQQAEERLRRFAETRFLLDTIDAAAAALGPNAELVDANRAGAIGHGDGAWTAAGLGGWDEGGAPNTRTRDGRIRAVFGLAPKRPQLTGTPPAQRSPDGVSGMFAGILSEMTPPARGSGLLGLGLPMQSNTFGGLIGAPSPAQSRRVAPEPQVLAAAIASAVLFFDWTLRGNNNSKRDLMSLDGRQIEGLTAPLRLMKA